MKEDQVVRRLKEAQRVLEANGDVSVTTVLDLAEWTVELATSLLAARERLAIVDPLQGRS